MTTNYGTNTGSMLGGNLNDYANQLGIVNWSKGRPANSAFRRGSVGLQDDFLHRVGFLNEIGPQRLDALRQGINSWSPGQVKATVDQNRARMLQQGSQQALMARARLAGAGASQDAQAGAELASRNRAQSQANDYENQVFSPEGQRQIQQMLMGAFGQAENLNLGPLLAMQQAMMENKKLDMAGQGGGVLGQLGGIAGSLLGGGINFGNLFGGGGGSNSGSNGSNLNNLPPAVSW